VVVIIGILAAIAIPKFANTKTKAYVTAMKSDLRNLVTAEEAFFSDSTYYTTATNLVTRNGFKNTSGVGVPAVTPGAGYWSATVTHSQISGGTCGIGVNTTNPIITTAGDGEPSCYVP
jgi:type II secretory pathway pseudopilin PulG